MSFIAKFGYIDIVILGDISRMEVGGLRKFYHINNILNLLVVTYDMVGIANL